MGNTLKLNADTVIKFSRVSSDTSTISTVKNFENKDIARPSGIIRTNLAQSEKIIEAKIGTDADLVATTPTAVYHNSPTGLVDVIDGDIPDDEYNPSPGTIKGVTIGSSCSIIGDRAFALSSSITGTLAIPGSVRTIGGASFVQCTGLTGLQLTASNNSSEILGQAFEDCTGLTGTLTIPGNFSFGIGSDHFAGCTGLTGLIIETGMTSIANNAFSGCTGIPTLTIPDSVETLWDSCFEGCTGMGGNLVIPDSVTQLKPSAFKNCSGFTSLTIGSGISILQSNCFEGFGAPNFINNFVIPSTITTISSSVFTNSLGLSGKITIPNSIITMGSWVFQGCANLTSIDCYITKTIFDKTDTLLNSGVTTIHARSTDNTWTASAGQTIGGKSGITVIKDLT